MTTIEGSPAQYIDVMERTGYYRNGQPTPGVLPASELRKPGQMFNRYRAIVDEEQLAAYALFQLSGAPCIYFRWLDGSNPDSATLSKLHRVAWNQGMAPLLWVVTPTQIHIFNCYSKPEHDDDPARHRLALFSRAAKDIAKLSQFAGRTQMETGKFWDDKRARKVNRQERVDLALLKDLAQAEKDLRSHGLEPALAHSLLGRSIFVSYLQDRGILRTEFFQEQFGASRFLDILPNVPLTYTLFKWVQDTFFHGGDLFPLLREKDGALVSEDDKVTSTHLDIIKDMLAITRNGQLSFWPYRFDVIPIELISSIYERFAHSADSDEAEALSTHYTPVSLVDTILSYSFKDLSPRAKVLDLTCGSAVFLVESLRRLVALRCEKGEQLTRKLIRETLHNQIFGVDISDEAVQISAFALYLTALELDPNPQPPSALKFDPLIGKNLFAGDAFDTSRPFNRVEPFASAAFDLVVGNPPWTHHKAHTASARAYCEERSYPLAWRHPPDQALLWRIGDFSRDSTRIGLILHATHFFSQQESAREARKALLLRYSPEVVVNLSDLRCDRLFFNSNAPAIILIASGRRATHGSSFAFVVAERTASFRRHGIIDIGPENVKRLDTYRVASSRDLLKVASWGNARDAALIERLRTVDTLATMIPSKAKRGQGFQKKRKSTKTPEFLAESMVGTRVLESRQMTAFEIDPEKLDKLKSSRPFHRKREESIYKSPLVISVRGLAAKRPFMAAVSEAEDIVYSELYYGVSTPDVRSARYLNAILNSKLIRYFLFLTASAWGVERDETKPEDIFDLPIPPLASVSSAKVGKVLSAEFKIREKIREGGKLDGKPISDLDDAVYDLYNLAASERVLVEDMQVTIDLRMKRERSSYSRPPKTVEMVHYAETVIGAIDPFLSALGERSVNAEILEVGSAPLRVVKFSVVPASQKRLDIPEVKTPGLQSVLEGIAANLSEPMAERVRSRRNLNIFDGSDIYFVKPARCRDWLGAEGLKDADVIIAHPLRSRHGSAA